MEDALYATLLLDHLPWSESVMNVTSARSKEDAQFVEDLEFQMLIIAKNAFNLKRIEMDVQKSLILEVQRQTCGTRERSMVLIKLDE